MIRRCEDPENSHYARYGGRGITVCARWHDVQLFIQDIEATIGPKPAGLTSSGSKAAYSLDRTDNNGNYERGNVRWATWSEQNLNK
jgi:hypothetical protein